MSVAGDVGEEKHHYELFRNNYLFQAQNLSWNNKMSVKVIKWKHSLLCVRELQADEVENLGSMRTGKILDEVTELHLAVRLPRHIYHIYNFVATWTENKHK